MEQQTQGKSNSRAVWIVLIAVVLLLAAGALWKSARSVASMSAAATSDEAQLAQSEPGSKIKVVLEVSEFGADGALRGTLLQKKTEETYVRTATKLTVHVGERSAFVMGKRDDVRSKAVVHVTGTVRGDRGMDAEQVVVLTNYVHVE